MKLKLSYLLTRQYVTFDLIWNTKTETWMAAVCRSPSQSCYRSDRKRRRGVSCSYYTQHIFGLFMKLFRTKIYREMLSVLFRL